MIIRAMWETIKARVLRGEKRIAPLKQFGRVFESIDKGSIGGSTKMLGNAEFKIKMKITRANGSIENLTETQTIKRK